MLLGQTLAVHLVGQKDVAVWAERLLHRYAGLHAVQSLENDVLHLEGFHVLVAEPCAVLQHLPQVDSTPLCGGHGTKAPRYSRGLFDLVQLGPSIPSALEGGHYFSFQEAAFQILQRQGDRLSTHAVHDKPVLVVIHDRNRVMMSNEPHRVGRQPGIQHELCWELSVARLVVVENQSGMALWICGKRTRTPVVSLWRIRQISNTHAFQQLQRVASPSVLLVDPPEWIYGLSSCQHDLVGATGMVCHKLCDVIDTILVADPNALFRRGVLCHVSGAVSGPGFGPTVPSCQLPQSFPDLSQAIFRQPSARELVLHDVDMLSPRIVGCGDARIFDVQMLLLEDLCCLTEKSRSIVVDSEFDYAASPRLCLTKGLPAPPPGLIVAPCKGSGRQAQPGPVQNYA
mmetsp:Transcript_69477/g.165649  ORF Transcript_69477/g.165649 Transcript_69477/m.165649 type:complete len:399 (-) Transcript_69477:99-1295(-)